MHKYSKFVALIKSCREKKSVYSWYALSISICGLARRYSTLYFLVDFKAQTYPFTIVVTGHKVGPDLLSPAGLQSDIVLLDIAVTTLFGTVPV